ncbi:unnamed protein product [Cochlearia groenlandica]
MSDRNDKNKSLSGKSHRSVVGDADENLDRFSVNRRGITSFDAKGVKHEGNDDEIKKNENDPLYSVFEVPLGTLSRLVLEARNVTSKVHSISTTKDGSKNETKPSRKNPTTRPSNIPTLRSSNIVPAIRSSSVPKKTTTTSTLASTSASVSSPKRTISRSLTPVSRKPQSRSPTPLSRISTTTTTTSATKKPIDSQRSRSLTPKSKPIITSNSSSKTTTTRSASVSSKPRTPPSRVKETVTLAFGRPVTTTTRNVNTPKRNTSPTVTRTRPKPHSPSPSSSSSTTTLIPTFSSGSKPLKPSAPAADSTKSGRKLLKSSIQIANNHLDASRNAKTSKNLFPSTMLYPQSIRRKRCSSEGSNSSNNHEEEEEEGKSLTKEENTEKKNDHSARYDEILDVKDVKDTNWLLNLDDEANQSSSLIFDNVFDSPPEPFSPL